MPKNKNINLAEIAEIYKLPIIVTKKDLEIEKIYFEFYNEEYWEKYKKLKIKKYEFKG